MDELSELEGHLRSFRPKRPAPLRERRLFQPSVFAAAAVLLALASAAGLWIGRSGPKPETGGEPVVRAEARPLEATCLARLRRLDEAALAEALDRQESRVLRPVGGERMTLR